MTARGPTQLREKSLRVWRAIAAAGIGGIGSSSLYDQFRGEFTDVEISTALQCLISGGYAKRTGPNRYGVWQITEACKLPKGEPAPPWLAEDALANSHAADLAAEKIEREERRKKVTVVMPKQPASVFNLGEEPFCVTRTRLGRPVTAVPPEEVQAPAPLDWKAAVAVAAPADEAPEAVAEPVAPAQAPSRDFICALDSDGDLYINSNGSELILYVEHTRKLLHYLDHLRADELLASLAEVPA